MQDMSNSIPHPATRNDNTVLAIIVASYLMIVVDISIVITGLPRIQTSLGFSAAQLSWVTNAYTLTFGGLLLLGARAGDILGRRRMFVLGLSLFTLASMAIGLAQSAIWLLAARAIQGAGAAVLAPSTLALLSTHFTEGPERTRAMSMYAAAAGVGATLGLVLGGVFADLVSWRAGFFINLPIGLLLIMAARRHITETPRHPGHFDFGGAICSTVGMMALVYGLVHAADYIEQANCLISDQLLFPFSMGHFHSLDTNVLSHRASFFSCAIHAIVSNVYVIPMHSIDGNCARWVL